MKLFMSKRHKKDLEEFAHRQDEFDEELEDMARRVRALEFEAGVVAPHAVKGVPDDRASSMG